MPDSGGILRTEAAMLSLMLFMFLCFLGMLGMFFYMLRSQEKMCQTLRAEHAQTRLLLRALESRLERNMTGPAEEHPAPSSAAAAPSQEPLLHLSFDTPASAPGRPAVDPGLDLHFDPDEQLSHGAVTR